MTKIRPLERDERAERGDANERANSNDANERGDADLLGEIVFRKVLSAPLERTLRRTITLTFDERKKSRRRCRLDDGTEVSVLLERGNILRGGDVLVAEDGTMAMVRAKPELVTTVLAQDPWTLARAAYHLGNRHIPLQIGEGFVRYEHDHVLDDMVRGLGLEADIGMEPFEPEGGSYARGDGGHHHGNLGGHQHGHGHSHAHSHDQSHDHSHGSVAWRMDNAKRGGK
jgi:urease accessory protein